jgi:hypothetical protein
LKDHGHDLFNDGIVSLGEALRWWGVDRGSSLTLDWRMKWKKPKGDREFTQCL